MAERKPLISVIVPVYNGEAYLKNCIDSICAQTYEPLEILLVNDGSTDRTGEVCEQIREQIENREKRDRRIQIITLADEGVSVARNTALAQAKGEYVTFVDADDRILPDMLEHLYRNLNATKSQVSGCSFFAWEREEEWQKQLQKRDSAVESNEFSGEQEIGPENTEIFSATEFREQLFRRNSRCWSKLYETKLLKEQGILFDRGLSIGEDMLFLAKITNTEARFCESPYQGYAYYQNQSGAMNRKFTAKSMDQITCWKRVGEMFGRTPESDSIVLVNTLLVLGRIAALPLEEAEQYRGEIAACGRTLQEYGEEAARKRLARGHKLKVLLAKKNPGLYVKLYHIWKKA